MYTHLQDHTFYEDMYDRHTVEDGRRGMVYYEDFYKELKKKLPKDDTLDRPGNAILLNVFYMQALGDELLSRYENRESRINEWRAQDQAKDDQFANARLTEEPYCQHCHKQGLRITDKSLMRRKPDVKYDDPEEVLFMLRCPHCKKNSAFWEDGTAWKPRPTLCTKCSAEMTHKTTSGKKTITFTYTCPACGHSHKDKIEHTEKAEEPDPDYDKDRVHFCLLDKEFRDRLFAVKRGLEDMAQFSREHQERENNKHIYDAIAEIKKPKIAELSTILAPVLEKAGYIEFSLDKPEIGKDVIVGFNCLDSKSDRSDYDSEKTLKKIIEKALEDTNWRLMSDGVSYRLGYLNGRLRAYEREEDIKKLILKSNKLKAKQKVDSVKTSNPAKVIKDTNGREIIL